MKMGEGTVVIEGVFGTVVYRGDLQFMPEAREHASGRGADMAFGEERKRNGQ